MRTTNEEALRPITDDEVRCFRDDGAIALSGLCDDDRSSGCGSPSTTSRIPERTAAST